MSTTLSADIPRDLRDVLADLDYIAGLPTSCKYNINSKSYVGSDSWVGAYWRGRDEETKIKSVDYINNTIDQAIEMGRNYPAWRKYLTVSVSKISNALTNMQHTYSSHQGIVSNIKVIRLRIDPKAFMVACQQKPIARVNPLADPTHYQPLLEEHGTPSGTEPVPGTASGTGPVPGTVPGPASGTVPVPGSSHKNGTSPRASPAPGSSPTSGTVLGKSPGPGTSPGKSPDPGTSPGKSPVPGTSPVLGSSPSNNMFVFGSSPPKLGSSNHTSIRPDPIAPDPSTKKYQRRTRRRADSEIETVSDTETETIVGTVGPVPNDSNGSNGSGKLPRDDDESRVKQVMIASTSGSREEE
jgi:hypothetical protein